MSGERAVVLVMHLQNEIVHPDGHIGRRGNARRVAESGLLERVAGVLDAARRAGLAVYYVGTGYDPQYAHLNRSVPLFAEHEPMGGMQAGSWGTRFHPEIAPVERDTVVLRAGIGPFANSTLAQVFPPPHGCRVYLMGVSTRLVVEAATFDLTDRGYAVTIVSDCCAAASTQAHEDALTTLRLFAEVVPAADVVERIASGSAVGNSTVDTGQH